MVWPPKVAPTGPRRDRDGHTAGPSCQVAERVVDIDRQAERGARGQAVGWLGREISFAGAAGVTAMAPVVAPNVPLETWSV